MAPTAQLPSITCKKLSESPNLFSIPSNYVFYKHPTENITSDHEHSIPTVDLSYLVCGDPDQKSKSIQELGKACQEWGFFIVVNHGIPETLMSAIIDVVGDFFDLPEEEKPEFQPKDVLDPIRYGTSFNAAKEKVNCWRDFLKVFIHPEFHSPDKPVALRELLLEYSERVRKLVRQLLGGISESLGLEEHEIEKALNLDSSLQIFIANFYPRCPNPDVAIGMPPHSDHGLLTLLIENDVGGLQIEHDGKWMNVHAPPNSFLVNTGDHLEIFSNGKYKSVLHRAAVNNQRTRISIAMANGPSLDTIVSPSSKLVQADKSLPAYNPMKYKEYFFSQQNNQLGSKDVLKQAGDIGGGGGELFGVPLGCCGSGVVG